MKLLKAEEMREIDSIAMNEYNIPGIILMENAGLRIVECIENAVDELRGLKTVILAGKGNNGGDGLVVARHLLNAGSLVDVFLLGSEDELSSDSRMNYDILSKMQANIYPLRNEEDLNRLMLSLLSAELIVDAIYGIGFKGSLNDFEAKIVKMVNWSKAALVVSADIPSGVEADTGKVHGPAIRADYTVTMALPKVGLIMEPGKEYSGTLNVADISIPDVLLKDKKLNSNLITEEMIKEYFQPRASETHKGTYGHALLLGGAEGMCGAMIMASYAALKSGAGLVTVGVPQSLLPIVQSSVAELMCRPLAQTRDSAISIDALPAIENLLGMASVCAIGPGMSRYSEANAVLRLVLEKAGIPVLIDADGINALEGDTAVLMNRQVPVIITPHPGEMSRLTGLSIAEIQKNRMEIAREYACKWGITVVLKGNKTVIASPSGETYINISGNPGMATAGSGDVLSGIITGLMAQGLKPLTAAVSGVYIHGLAGDKAVESTGERGLVAGDLINALPDILSKLEK